MTQRDLSRTLRGRRSKRAARQHRLLAKRHRKIANRRRNRIHQITTRLVREHKIIATEKLSANNMTRSARGTTENPGKNVAQKAGLNRSILDTAPGGFFVTLAYKAEEAGCELITLPTRTLKPSQRDTISWTVEQKTLKQRHHVLPNGITIGRDHAATLVMLRAALQATGREPAWVPV